MRRAVQPPDAATHMQTTVPPGIGSAVRCAATRGTPTSSAQSTSVRAGYCPLSLPSESEDGSARGSRWRSGSAMAPSSSADGRGHRPEGRKSPRGGRGRSPSLQRGEHVTSFLRLAESLADLEPYRHFFATAAVIGAAHRCGAQMIEPDGNAHMPVGHANAVGRIEADPAEIRDVALGPGMTGIVHEHIVAPVEIAAHIAGRHAESVGNGNEDLSEVRAHAPRSLESFGCRGGGGSGPSVEGNVLVDACQQVVQDRNSVDHGRSGKLCRVGPDRAVRTGKWGFAQEQGGREPLYGPPYHPASVPRLDLALDQETQFADRAHNREGLGDVAERVLLRCEPAVGGHVDAPVHDILTPVVARRQAQGLDHARTRSIVTIDGLVREADAHGSFPQFAGPCPALHAEGEGREGDGSYIKYWELTAAPSALLSVMNS